MYYLVINGKVQKSGSFESLDRSIDRRSYDHTKREGKHTTYLDRWENEVAAIHPL